jgi:hypothetical protein
MGRRKGSTTPNDWLSGPDPIDHRLFNDCQRARAQAWYRGEEWFISEQDYILLWRTDDRYKRKGRTTGSLCMVRKDLDSAWRLDNVEIVERHKHFRKCGLERKERMNA